MWFDGAPGPVSVDLSTGTATGEGTDTIAVPAYSGGIVGSAYDDELTGSNGPDRFDGGAGDDRIRGLGGNDEIQPGEGDDVVRGGDGDDFIFSREKGRDRFYGDGGNDGVTAYGRGSAVGGGEGDDFLVASYGASAHGGSGNDEISADLVRGKKVEVDGGDGLDAVRLRVPKKRFARGLRYVVDVPRNRVTVGGVTRARYEGNELLSFSAPGGSLTVRRWPRARQRVGERRPADHRLRSRRARHPRRWEAAPTSSTVGRVATTSSAAPVATAASAASSCGSARSVADLRVAHRSSRSSCASISADACASAPVL